AVAARYQLDGTVLFHAMDAPRPYLFGQPVDDLDAGQVSLVHGAVERLAREGLLMQCAVGVSVKEAAQLVLQLVDSFDCPVDQRPGQFLVGQPLAALDGVHEMPFGRIARCQGHVVAALDHARAPALSQQPLDGHGNVQARRRVVRMQRSEQPRAARPQDQHIRLAHLQAMLAHRVTPRLASTAWRRSATSCATCSYSDAPWLSMATSNGPKSRMRNFHSDSGFRSSRSTSSMHSIHVVSRAAVPPTMARYAPPSSANARLDPSCM